MRAIVYEDYGEPDVLLPTETAAPRPAADEVLIRVAAAGVNPIDARLRSGEVRWLLPGGFPRVPGYDVAGVVERAGRDCPLGEGQRVMAFLDHLYGGGYAELATCSATSVVPLPDDLPFEEVASMPLAGSTALQSLRDHGRLQKGDRVLLLGASGGVGAFAVQIAKAYGATVTGVASGKHEAFVCSLGADDFLDYERQDYAETGAQTGVQSGQCWDLVFDVAGKSSYQHAKPALTAEGRYVTTEPSFRGLAVALVTWPQSRQAKPMLAVSRGKDLEELLRLRNEGRLGVTVDRVYPLEEAAEAHRRIESESFCGKLVVTP
ncbi:Zinc-type alcohol dehydrogenase-like protein [Pseudobythopirellula maris]|uniref:Zinc-type alcohol dehydrogenase-like protein n=1 Tax=Pseudobythopirellula maris TaxID=2527991 RepID=A0A5C5ZS58_9BACT|nr:NAD(P)-dependent alcohol dehydrogenase [Pseudobythopirellula maris]TWT90364.1 Zinc-type alcohol dehydrogenase-like protein [Pseudobythopirellula maris]